MSTEKRKHPRIPASIDTIYFTEHPSESDRTDRMYYPGTITNISEGGLGMIANYPHKQDNELWLEGIIKESNQPISGKIRWINGDEQYSIGIQFLERPQ